MFNLFKRHKYREPKPQPAVEVSDKHVSLRFVLLIVFVVVAVVSLTYGFTSLFSTDPGWRTVEVEGGEVSCGQDFVFNYNVGVSGVDATQEYRSLTSLYTQACRKAYRLFSNEVTDTPGNLFAVNSHINEAVEVDPALYQAFQTVQHYGSRLLYMAPVYAEQERMFSYTNELDAMRYDPAQNPEIMAYIGQMVVFTNDPAHVDLELLENNQVKLTVSAEYLAFAEENGITEFLDFGWTENAFIIDYLAQSMIDGGYTRGCISSYDGFSRNLDVSGESYSFNIFDRLGNDLHMPAKLDYTGVMSIVYLRNYPMSGQSMDRWHYMSFSNGTIATVFLDPADGVSKSATDNLVSYSKDATCSQILMESAAVYLADTLDEGAIAAMQENGIYSIWFEGETLRFNQTDIHLRLDESLNYTAQLVK
jgi:hypothetical protein